MVDIDTVKQELLKVKCTLCSNLLTIPPITITLPEGNELKCGRCKNINSTPNCTRNVFFENIAKHFTFPCSFENCEETLAWGLFEDHEQVCLHKKLVCPVGSGDCSDITLGAIETHINEEHEALFQTIQNERYSLLLQFDDVGDFIPSVIFLMHDIHKFLLFIHKKCVALVSISVQGIYQNYNVMFTNTTAVTADQYSLHYENQAIIPFNDRIHCIHCLERTCSSVTHPNSTSNIYGTNLNINYFGTKINWPEVLRLFPDSVNIIIDLNANSKIGRQHAFDIGIKHFKELRKSLECVVCIQYVQAPIFNCSLGHSVCSRCIHDINTCPSCRSSMTSSRNYALENIIENVQLPCKFWINGCKVMHHILNAAVHEENCPNKD